MTFRYIIEWKDFCMAWDQLADEQTLATAVQALIERNVIVEVVATKQEALAKVTELIPEQSDVMTGASMTLEEIGFSDALKNGTKQWKNLKEEIRAETNEEKRTDLRRKSVTSEYFLGSVHAIAKTGEIYDASASGSQLPAYAYSSPHVIWVAGTQKITQSSDEANKRVREYCYPIEDKRMKKAGAKGSMIGKMLIFERERQPGRVTLILVKEKLGV